MAREAVAAHTLAELLADHARSRADRPALVVWEGAAGETARLDYAELDLAARRTAGFLAARGLARERILIACPSPRDFLIGVLGCFYAGAIAVPVPAGLRSRLGLRVLAIAADCAPALILAGGSVRAEAEASSLEAIDWCTPADCAAAAPLVPGSAAADPAAPCLLQYTSGSTSEPRGAVLTHANLMANFAMLAEAAGLGEEITVSWLPLHHDMGLIAMALQTLAGGGTCVLMTPLHFLQRPLDWLRCISRYRASYSGAPTFAYRLCAERATVPDEFDLSSWHRAVVSAEPVRAAVLECFAGGFAARGFDPAAWFPAYGLAEATVFATGRAGAPLSLTVDASALAEGLVRPAAGEGAEARTLVACGRPAAGGRVLVVDAQTAMPLPSGQIGEIWVAGPHVAGGYWNRVPAEGGFGARAAGWKENWLRTGDLGFVDEGQVYVVGRSKDAIIVRGAVHHPQDIEESVARAAPAFLADGGAAFQLEPGSEGEERIVVAHEVRRQEWRDADAEALARAACREVVREHGLQLFDLVLLPPRRLPRTSSGKVQRYRVRDAYLAGELAGTSPAWPGLARYRPSNSETTT